MHRCERCKNESSVLSMSYFNTEMLCPDCEEKEKRHPKYQEAKKAELEAVKSGNYNFQGIGKPSDL